VKSHSSQIIVSRVRLEAEIARQDKMLSKVPKHLRSKGHLISIEAILRGDFSRLECFGDANTSDACLQCPDNNECATLTCSKVEKQEA
jgi:hypothetical protein